MKNCRPRFQRVSVRWSGSAGFPSRPSVACYLCYFRLGSADAVVRATIIPCLFTPFSSPFHLFPLNSLIGKKLSLVALNRTYHCGTGLSWRATSCATSITVPHGFGELSPVFVTVASSSPEVSSGSSTFAFLIFEITGSESHFGGT